MLTFTSHLGQNVGFGWGGWAVSQNLNDAWSIAQSDEYWSAKLQILSLTLAGPKFMVLK